MPGERLVAHTGAFPVAGRASVVNAYDTSAPQVSYLSTADAGARPPYGRTMDRSTALEQLPAAYATALRLNDEGATHNRIARTLDVPVQAVPRLLEIGASKLDAILAGREASGRGGNASR